MKTYNEMAESVFKRRDEYEIKEKKRRKVIKRAAVSVSSFCMAVVIGFGIYNSGLLRENPKTDLEDAVYPGTQDYFDESNKIVITPIDSVSDERMSIALFRDDFIRMEKEELNEYYGINVFPEVPEDLKEWGNKIYGIYKREGGKGELYWDRNQITYDNGDISRSLNVSVETAGVPANTPVFYDKISEKSIINNVSVAIAKSKRGNLYSEFTYKDTCFFIFAQGLSDEEFVSAIKSLIK